MSTLTTALPDSQGDSLPGIPDAAGASLGNVNAHRSPGAPTAVSLDNPLRPSDSAEGDLLLAKVLPAALTPAQIGDRTRYDIRRVDGLNDVQDPGKPSTVGV